MNPTIIYQVKNAALVVIIPNLLLASISAAGEQPAGLPFESLRARISQVEGRTAEVEAVVPPLAEGIRALLTFTAPQEIVVPSAGPCPEGYKRSIGGFHSICVLSAEPAPPPPAPEGCEDGYVLKETLPDGSPVPTHLVICERIGETSATVYITHRAIRYQVQSLTAQCPESFVVTGGGYSSIDVDPISRTGSVSTNLLVYSSRPISPDQWSISGKFPDAGFHDVTAYALCIREPAT